MRLFFELVLIWVVIAMSIGVAGWKWADSLWTTQLETSFREAARAAARVAEIQNWDQPVEADPKWSKLENEFGLGVIPLRQASSGSSNADLTTRADLDVATGDGLVAWDRIADAGYRMSLTLPVDSHRLGVAKLRMSREVKTKRLGKVWWIAWALLNCLAAVIAVVAGWAMHRDQRTKKRLLQPWFRALESQGAAASGRSLNGLTSVSSTALSQPRSVEQLSVSEFRNTQESDASNGSRQVDGSHQAIGSETQDELLPQIELHESDLSLQMDSVANSVNEAYAKLKSANDRSDLVLGNLRDGVLALNERSEILLANKALRRLLDIPDENLLYRPLVEVTRAPFLLRIVKSILADENPLEEEVELGGGQRHLRIVARPLTLDGHRAPSSPANEPKCGVLLTVRDETMFKKVDLIKRDFVTNASHELKTPLAAIRAYAETLQLGAIHDSDAAEHFVANIVEQADRLDSLVKGLLQLSRVEDGSGVRFQPFDAVAAIEPCIDSCQVVADGKGVGIHVEIPEGECLIRSDREGFQTIVTNLLSNGVRYTEADGHVTIRLTEQADALILEVEDTGIGMSAEDLERIFERFYRAEKHRSIESGGTGLGLAIVKHLTNALGGTVSVASELGEGSCFVVELPKLPRD